MSNLMKFMMVVISIAFLAFINTDITARKQSEVTSKKAILPKHQIAA